MKNPVADSIQFLRQLARRYRTLKLKRRLNLAAKTLADMENTLIEARQCNDTLHKRLLEAEAKNVALEEKLKNQSV